MLISLFGHVKGAFVLTGFNKMYFVNFAIWFSLIYSDPFVLTQKNLLPLGSNSYHLDLTYVHCQIYMFNIRMAGIKLNLN